VPDQRMENATLPGHAQPSITWQRSTACSANAKLPSRPVVPGGTADLSWQCHKRLSWRPDPSGGEGEWNEQPARRGNHDGCRVGSLNEAGRQWQHADASNKAKPDSRADCGPRREFGAPGRCSSASSVRPPSSYDCAVTAVERAARSPESMNWWPCDPATVSMCS